MTVMSKQSEEQWEEAKALAPPPKQEAEIYVTKCQKFETFTFKWRFSPARPSGLRSTSTSPLILQVWF